MFPYTMPKFFVIWSVWGVSWDQKQSQIGLIFLLHKRTILLHSTIMESFWSFWSTLYKFKHKNPLGKSHWTAASMIKEGYKVLPIEGHQKCSDTLADFGPPWKEAYRHLWDTKRFLPILRPARQRGSPRTVTTPVSDIITFICLNPQPHVVHK